MSEGHKRDRLLLFDTPCGFAVLLPLLLERLLLVFVLEIALPALPSFVDECIGTWTSVIF